MLAVVRLNSVLIGFERLPRGRAGRVDALVRNRVLIDDDRFSFDEAVSSK